MNTPDEHYSVEQVADLLRSKPNHIHNLIADGRIKTINPTDKKADRKISREALDQFIEQATKSLRQSAAVL